MACFNTDDGIRRAAIKTNSVVSFAEAYVSIPMTVLGGLQCCQLRRTVSLEQRFQYR